MGHAQTLEDNMVFLGLVAMVIRHVRVCGKPLKKCHRASIRIIMVTGDYGFDSS